MKAIFLLLIITCSIQSLAQIDEANNFYSLIDDSGTEELFSNPNFVHNLIKDKRIILLGELDHGDGSSFELKTAFIKYLHEKHGFNNLVFESGLINMEEYWKSIEGRKNVLEAAKENIYYIWSQVKETETLFDYIEKEYDEEHPLKVVGIDPQFSGTKKEWVFIEMLKEELPESEVEKTAFKELSYELKIMSKWLEYPPKNSHQINESLFDNHLNYYKEKILAEKEGEEKELWNLYFENIKTFASIKWEKKEGSFAKRDEQMFRNLKYWLDKNKNEKFIVWAANGHIIRNDKDLKGKDSDYEIIGIKKLGDHIFKAYSKDTYSIALSARTGRTLNFINKRKTSKIGKNQSCSLEEKLKQFEFAFIDLESFENAMNIEEYESQLFYPNVKCISKWSNHFDGVLFLNEMKPSTPKW